MFQDSSAYLKLYSIAARKFLKLDRLTGYHARQYHLPPISSKYSSEHVTEELMEVVDPQEAAAVGIGALVPQRCLLDRSG